MTSSRTRRTTAVAVLAVTASSGVALAAATPASAHVRARAHTSLSIRAARSVINPGASDVVRGDLAARGHHVANRAILLQSKATGTTGWVGQARHRTGAHGGVAFTVTPATTTRYRLVFMGNGWQKPAKSGVVAVHIRDNTKATSLTISQDTVFVEPGGSDGIHGLLTQSGTPLAGATVLLKSETAKQRYYHLVTSGPTQTDGTVSFTVTPTVRTHYVLVFRKTATADYARSKVATVHVRQPSSLSIRARVNGKNLEVISGQLRGGANGAAKALANRPVTLQESTDANTWTPVSTVRANKHGMVTFREAAPTATEYYRLVFAGGWNFDPCQSAAAEVIVSA